MASLIRIKRSDVSGNPGVLAAGELAYSNLTDNGSNGGDRLYIGMGTETDGNAANHLVIGGKFFTDMLDHAKGTLTANSALIVDANSKIDILNVDNLTLNSNTISSTNTDGNITIDPNGTGYVQIVGTNGLVIPVGNTVQQGPSVQGAIRFNNETGQFEGYSGTNWASLGGVRSVDGLTYIVAESEPGESDDTLFFHVATGLETNKIAATLDETSLSILNTTESTTATTGALIVAGGVGIAKNLNVAGNTNLGDAVTDLHSITGTLTVSMRDNVATAFDLKEGTNSYVKAITTDGAEEVVFGSTPVVRIQNTTVADGEGNAALIVAGGVDIGGALVVQGSFVGEGSAEFTQINDTPIGNVTPSSGAFTVLDVDNIRINNNDIISTDPDGDINITPNGSGKTVIGNLYIGSDSIEEYIQDITGGQLVEGEAIDITYNDENGTSTISAELATASNRGVASFNSTDFTVTDGNVTLNVERVEDIVGDQLVGGESVTLTYNDAGDGSLTIDADIATTTTRGVASFETQDFNVTNGAVELKDTVIKGITTDTGALTPASHAISIIGGEGIDVTHDSTTITVAGELATTSNIGVASFDSGDFDVTNGAVSIKTAGVGNAQLENDSVTFGSTEVELGGTSTSIAGLTELTVDNLNFNGNEISVTNTNGSITLNPDGDGTVDVSGSRITNVGAPLQASDAVNKEYVDSVAEGLSVKPAVRAATTTNLTATYDNGTDGVGSTLTISPTATLDIDGVTDWSEFDGILIKDQTNTFENGRYYVSTVGSALTEWVLTRCAKCDQPTEIPSMYVFVQEGTTYASTGWVASVDDPADFDVGVDGINFIQFSGAGTYLAGDGLNIDGTTFSVNVPADGVGGLEIVSDNVQVAPTIAGNGLTYNSGVLNVVGTSDRITVSADAIDIASTYVGQTSITTLGTIGTGTWQGNVINPTYGGTGVNNGSSTITIGGNLSFSGAYTTNINVTGATNVTMPTSGTLATLTNSETISNKTITNSSIGSTDPSTGAFTTLSASGQVTFTANTNSTSTSTGALVVTGGVGVGADISVGGDLIGSGAATSLIDGFTIDGGTY